MAMAMASSSLHRNLKFIRSSGATSPPRRLISIRCGGPRSNRGPLVKGRILSIEAIHAIQALKRAERTSTLESHAPRILPRLIKADLLSTFRELLRQQHIHLALTVFRSITAEYPPDLTLYADLVTAFTSQGLTHEIDHLLRGILQIDFDDKGLIKLVKALVEADRRDSTLWIYGLMKKCGWGRTVEVDEYVALLLSTGFRRMGEDVLADEIDKDVNRLFRTHFAKSVV